MNKRKIFNDPVYGFVTIPYEIIYDLIQHPYVQRLRRITQLGLTHLTYPGALHTRFQHALGAMHLMTLSIDVLKSKGEQISEAEAEAACIAILLHDIGHGPFSHALEGLLLDAHHEDLSLMLMQKLNEEFDGALSLAIDIFKGEYHKKWLHELISSQLDVDRLDYLNRDSFYSGVMEGKIGYDRIIKMLKIHRDQLVVEEKGIYSIENYLVARKIMYWQVYLHKTVLAAERMLVHAITRARELYAQGKLELTSGPMREVFSRSWHNKHDQLPMMLAFIRLDDHDIIMFLKQSQDHEDTVLRYLATGLIQRRLFRVELSESEISDTYRQQVVDAVAHNLSLSPGVASALISEGCEVTEMYASDQEEIRILLKNDAIVGLSGIESVFSAQRITRHYICYPKPY